MVHMVQKYCSYPKSIGGSSAVSWPLLPMQITDGPGLLACGLMYNRTMHRNKSAIYAPVCEHHDRTALGAEVGNGVQLGWLTLKHNSQYKCLKGTNSSLDFSHVPANFLGPVGWWVHCVSSACLRFPLKACMRLCLKIFENWPSGSQSDKPHLSPETCRMQESLFLFSRGNNFIAAFEFEGSPLLFWQM